MKLSHYITQLDVDAIRSFQKFWEETTKGNKYFEKGPKVNVRTLRKYARAIYYQAYIISYQDAAISFAEDAMEDINRDLEELHNLNEKYFNNGNIHH